MLTSSSLSLQYFTMVFNILFRPPSLYDDSHLLIYGRLAFNVPLVISQEEGHKKLRNRNVLNMHTFA